MLRNEDCLGFLQKSKKKYDLIIADPPYNNCVEAEWDNQWENDEEYLKWLEERIKLFQEKLNPSGNLILYCKRQFHHKIKTILDKYLIEQRSIIWVRRRMMDMTRGKTLASGYEPILWYVKSDNYFYSSENAKIPPQAHLRHRSEYQKGGRLEKGVGLTDAWTDINALPHNSKEKTIHPTQKPQVLSDRIVNLFSPPKGSVYIPFGGSGSEIISCILLDREWESTEINSTFCSLIKKRIESSQVSLNKWIIK